MNETNTVNATTPAVTATLAGAMKATAQVPAAPATTTKPTVAPKSARRQGRKQN